MPKTTTLQVIPELPDDIPGQDLTLRRQHVLEMRPVRLDQLVKQRVLWLANPTFKPLLNLAYWIEVFTTLDTLMTFKTTTTLSFIVCLGFSSLTFASSDKEGEALSLPKANYAVADADASGGLSQDEFIVFIDANADADFGKAAKIKKRNAYSRAFSKIDADGNDNVSWEEFADQQ